MEMSKEINLWKVFYILPYLYFSRLQIYAFVGKYEGLSYEFGVGEYFKKMGIVGHLKKITFWGNIYIF